jgi:hypothetical protein
MMIWTQDDGNFLQELAITIEQVTHCNSPALHKNHIYRGPGKAFSNGIRDRSIKQQVLLEGKKALRQTLG